MPERCGCGARDCQRCFPYTEPKVVHEWTEDGGKYRIHDTDVGPMLYVVRPSPQSPCQFVKELARLAARVQELEKELSEICDPEAAADYEDRIDALAGMVNKEQAENKRLREALGEYGHHKPRCKLDPCDCGILAALKEKP